MLKQGTRETLIANEDDLDSQLEFPPCLVPFAVRRVKSGLSAA